MLEPKISVTLLDVTDNPIVLDVTIDTAFTGFLALPTFIITQLCLPSVSKVPIELADGSTVDRMYYDARIEWRGVVRSVRAVEMETTPVIGTQLL